MLSGIRNINTNHRLNSFQRRENMMEWQSGEYT